jgi:hypothetical protein
MIAAAIKAGCSSIGISEHCFISFAEKKYALSPEETQKYIDQLKGLKKKYKSCNKKKIWLQKAMFHRTQMYSVRNGYEHKCFCSH